jgi:cathepsin L
MDSVFDYMIKSSKGLEGEEDYPYTAKDGSCKFNAGKIKTSITGRKSVAKGNENDLQSSIMKQPISVAIDAGHSSFQFYHSGVYYEAACSASQLDHGVLAVGYGTSSAAYYIVKNSWGTGWGAQGYILMARNRNNHCGIATMSSYPIV